MSGPDRRGGTGRPGSVGERRFWSPAFTALLALFAAALVVLVLLGNWQMRRLAWKEQLLATIEDRRTGPAATVFDVIDLWERKGDVDYSAMRATGTLEPVETYVYATRSGQVGWHVLSPLRLADGRALIVNRGFVPDALRDPDERPGAGRGAEGDDASALEVEVEGLARDPLFERPNRFVPDNEADEFYWKDYPAIVEALDLAPDETLPFLMDAGPTAPGTWPEGGVTIIDLPNNHLGYAVTWYGIGLGLVGVGTALVLQRRRRLRSGTGSGPDGDR